MARGGSREGAGRKPGKPNKTTEQRQKAIKELSAKIALAVPDAFAGDAHEFLMAVYKDPSMPLPVRVDAAKAAVGYEKPKLQAVEHSGNAENPLSVVFDILGSLDGATRGLPAGSKPEDQRNHCATGLAS